MYTCEVKDSLNVNINIRVTRRSNTRATQIGARIMKIHHVEIGICGLSCRLCPAYYRETQSRCGGCKSQYRMGAPCPFHNCALKKKNVESCGLCSENMSCGRWRKHREMGKQHDSIVCYQKLEDNINLIQKSGLEEFERQQKTRERVVQSMLSEFNDGRSKTFYCIAATILEIDELEKALEEAREKSINLDLKLKAEIMHSILNNIAKNKGYLLKLRK